MNLSQEALEIMEKFKKKNIGAQQKDEKELTDHYHKVVLNDPAISKEKRDDVWNTIWEMRGIIEGYKKKWSSETIEEVQSITLDPELDQWEVQSNSAPMETSSSSNELFTLQKSSQPSQPVQKCKEKNVTRGPPEGKVQKRKLAFFLHVSNVGAFSDRKNLKCELAIWTYAGDTRNWNIEKEIYRHRWEISDEQGEQSRLMDILSEKDSSPKITAAEGRISLLFSWKR